LPWPEKKNRVAKIYFSYLSPQPWPGKKKVVLDSFLFGLILYIRFRIILYRSAKNVCVILCAQQTDILLVKQSLAKASVFSLELRR